MTDMEYTLDDKVLRKPPADPVAALADVLGRIERMEDGYHAAWIRPREDHRPLATAIVPALDAAGFAVVPKETAKRDLEECLRQNGYAIDLVQRNERLQEALDEWERMARQEAKEWNDKHI